MSQFDSEAISSRNHPQASGWTGLVSSGPAEANGPLLAGTNILGNASNLYVETDDLQDQARLKLQIPCAAIGVLFAAADASFIVLASLLGARGYQDLISHAPWNLNFHVGAGVTAALLYVLVGRSSGFYQMSSLFSVQKVSSIVWQWFLISLILAMLAFLFRIGVEFSRGSIICFAGLALPMLLISRNLMKAALASAMKQGRVQGRRAVVVGLRDELAIISHADLLRRFGLNEVARVACPAAASWPSPATKSILASLDRALALARDRGAEEIVLAFRWNETRLIELIREKLRSSPLPVELLPDRNVRNLIENPSFSINRSFAIGIQRPPLSATERLAKRLFDVVGASVALVLLSPFMALTAVAIKLDSPGPIFFRQVRSGFNARRFRIFKFRTMTVMEEGDNVAQAIRHDPRVTRVGAILRATSLDELPQLFNVLLGDMSLIGPRPHAIAHDGHYGSMLSEYAFRHHVKPGMTGWAQIHGCRGETAQIELMKKRVDCDLWYINHWSIGLDLLILLRTPGEVLRRRNAY
ncbi:undecaprenyl-phosphate glucose phosphotransferase [Bradyrhizobium sp. ISRA442]|uniref:undecaprenyl-phosphate glucose phosphotransferase n=1 Tax=Bradyrhizobium sp. ISRA442 TaxID=2866197 RepID=UPI00311B11AA